MFYIRYNASTNNLLDVSPTPLEPIDNTVVEERAGDIPDFSIVAWNPAVLDFYHKNNTRVISKLQFLTRFSVIERVNIRASRADPFVEDFLELMVISDVIDLDDRNLTAALGYLEYIGLLSKERVAEVGG